MDHIPAVGPVAAAAGPALKPRERSSTGTARPPPPPAPEEAVAAQSAKAPESEGNLLVVATTENP